MDGAVAVGGDTGKGAQVVLVPARTHSLASGRAGEGVDAHLALLPPVLVNPRQKGPEALRAGTQPDS